jgi:CheY-like chemotaxis protein
MSAKSPIPTPPRRARILCADDEVSITCFLRRLLEASGYEVHVTNDGQTALTALRTHPVGFDVVISDHDMPGLTGLELVRRARAGGCAARFIIFSGSMRADLAECYAELGVTRHLAKPVGLSVLLYSGEQLLHESEHH